MQLLQVLPVCSDRLCLRNQPIVRAAKAAEAKQAGPSIFRQVRPEVASC